MNYYSINYNNCLDFESGFCFRNLRERVKSDWPPFFILCHPMSFVYFSFVILCRPLLIKSCLFLCHPTSSYNHRKLVIISYPMSSCVILCPPLSDFTHRKWSYPVSSYTHRESLFLCHPVSSYVQF